MSDQNVSLARRLSAKRLPRIASALAIGSGLSTAALLILAAGNSHAGPTVAMLIAEGALEPQATQLASRPPASFFAQTASNMRGTMDLAGVPEPERIKSAARLR